MCAQQVTWQEPDETTVTTVEINRSATLYGSYTVVETIDATDDGLPKTSSNSWVVTYTDQDGVRTDWYKIRFYDGTNYSGYSDPTTSEELLRLCTVDDVKEILDTTGRWTDDDVFNAITKEDKLIYIEAGTPIQASWSEIGKIDSTVQTRYYVGEENIHRVDRVFYGTTTKTELYLDDGYRQNLPYGMVEILPVASSGITPDVDCDIEMHYVPKIYNEYASHRAAKRLLEKIDTTSGGDASKELDVMKEALGNIEMLLANRFAMQASSNVRYYDKLYGVNRKHILQNYDRNRYIGSTNW